MVAALIQQLTILAIRLDHHGIPLVKVVLSLGPLEDTVVLKPRVLLVQGIQGPLGVNQLVLLNVGPLLHFQLAEVVDDAIGLALDH